MARIISSRKKYVPVKDLVVYPSKTETSFFGPRL